MRIAGMLAGFAVAICAATKADAIQNATDGGRGAVSAPLELSHEVRPFPRPPVIVNGLPSVLPSNNGASSPAQAVARAACTGKRSRGELQKIPKQRPAS
jgi:hypothetical protein